MFVQKNIINSLLKFIAMFRKFFLFFLVILFVIFVSCEKEVVTTDGDFKISSPTHNSEWQRGRSITIKWHENTSEAVIITLIGANGYSEKTVAMGGSRNLEISEDIELGEYKIIMTSKDNTKKDETDYFYVVEYEVESTP